MNPRLQAEAAAEAQQEEILRRCEEYLANRSIAKPIDAAFFKRLRRNLPNARARQAPIA